MFLQKSNYNTEFVKKDKVEGVMYVFNHFNLPCGIFCGICNC